MIGHAVADIDRGINRSMLNVTECLIKYSVSGFCRYKYYRYFYTFLPHGGLGFGRLEGSFDWGRSHGRRCLPDDELGAGLSPDGFCGGLAASLRFPMAWRVCAVVYV